MTPSHYSKQDRNRVTERTDRRLRVAVLLETTTPWLNANFNASAKLMDFVTVETGLPVPLNGGSQHFDRVSTMESGSGRNLASNICNALARVNPDVVVTLGWTGERNLAGLQYCAAQGIPIVVATDSTEKDYRRAWWREIIKSRIISLYSAGWAAGRAAGDYLSTLGMPRSQVVIGPVDSVDTEHFAKGADAARAQGDMRRHQMKLPELYFLAVSRFVQEKNLPGLLKAYYLYKEQAEGKAWKLVLIGGGPLEEKVRGLIAECNLANDVLLPGHVDFTALPAYYAFAGAFVHASLKDTWAVVVNVAMAAGLPVLVSKQCGSAHELIQEGTNGFLFDAVKPVELASLFHRIAHDEVERIRMGEASRRLIEQWNPEAYAASLRQVAERACSVPARRPNMLEKALLQAFLRWEASPTMTRGNPTQGLVGVQRI